MDVSVEIRGAARRLPLMPVGNIARHGPFSYVSGNGDGQLRLELDGSGLEDGWVGLAFRSDRTDPDLVPVLRLELRDPAGRKPDIVLPWAEEDDWFGWIGWLPSAATLVFEAAPGSGRFMLDSVRFRRLPAARVVAQALVRRPVLALTGLGWGLLTYRMRARARMRRAVQWGRESTRYRRRLVVMPAATRLAIERELEGWSDPPLLSLVMPVFNPDPEVLKAAIVSVQRQVYPHWELCITDDASTDSRVPEVLVAAARRDERLRPERRSENGHIARATNDAIDRANGTFVVFMDHDDLLTEDALYEVAKTARTHPGVVLIYSDEDKVDGADRLFDPHFKPDWDPELLFGQNYVNHLTAIRSDRVRALGGLRPGFEGSQDHDLLLRLSDDLSPGQVCHIPRVLYHWRAAHGSGTMSDRAPERAAAARLQALRDLIERRGWPHRAEPGAYGFNRLVRALPDPAPLVSVVIPTRDRAELLETALDGLLSRTAYPRLEVVIVDNDSVEDRTLALFRRLAGDPRVRLLPSPGPFNFSMLSNEGARAAGGDLLLFLNNDVEIIEPDWLTEMASIAVEPDVGAVGAKLLYPDGTLQHGGVVLGVGGVAGHSHPRAAGSDPGYFARLTLTHQVSAVTGACLMTRRTVFEAVGGFDDEHLKIAFNDVDFCLKVTAAGHRVIWTPHATLIHHESKSRGYEDTPEKKERFAREVQVMLERWGPRLRRDPFYNPNLRLDSAEFKPR